RRPVRLHSCHRFQSGFIPIFFRYNLPSSAVHDQGGVVANKGNSLRITVITSVYAGGMFPQHIEAVKLIDSLQGIRRFGSVIGIGKLAARSHHGLGSAYPHCKKGNIYLMHPPVGHQTASIVPKPTEIKMESVFVEGTFWCWPKPHIIIHTSRWLAIGFHGYRLHPALIGPTFHQTNLPELSGFYKIDSRIILRTTSLPLPHLNNLSVAFGGFKHDVTLLDGIGQWLLHINVLPRCQAVHQVETVPVVRGTDNYSINILVLKHFSVVRI